MKSFNIQKSLLAAAASALVLAFAAPAMAADTAPVFTINTNSILGAGNGSIFQANQILGTSSELLRTVGNTHTGNGYLAFTSFALNAEGVAGTGILDKYKLYATFQVADVLQSGVINQSNSINTVTRLDFQVYADPARDTTFTRANASTNTDASANDIGMNDILLGVGSLISGVDGFDALGGAYFNSIETFAVCSGAGVGNIQGKIVPVPACTTAQGSGFFAAPIPFYGLAFDAFNNSTQGVSQVGNLVSINQASGTIDFNRIPEPGSLALLGLGLMGIGATLRRRSV